MIKRQPKYRTIAAAVPFSVWREYQRHAAETGTGLGAYICSALITYLDDHPLPVKPTVKQTTKPIDILLTQKAMQVLTVMTQEAGLTGNRATSVMLASLIGRRVKALPGYVITDSDEAATVRFNIPVSVYKRLIATARRRNVSISSIVNGAIHSAMTPFNPDMKR